MKKLLIYIFTSLLIIALLGGCSNSGAQPAANSNTPPSSSSEGAPNDKELNKAMDDLGEALEKLATPGWPTGKISDKVPEYPFGEVRNSGDFGGGEYVILISPTNKEEYKKYLTLLEGEGYTISSGDDGARLGTLALRFQFNNSETLQIIVSEAGSSQWPSFLGGLLPPDKGTLYGEAHIPNLSDSDREMGQYYVASFTLVDLTEEDCLAFIKKQVDNGWRDGGDMAFKDIEIDGTACELALQFVQFYDGEGDFNLEAWKKQ